MPATDIGNETQHIEATIEKNDEEVQSAQPVAESVSDSSLFIAKLHEYFKVDTFMLSARDFPSPVMEPTFLDSCVNDEVVALPTDIQQLAGSETTEFDSLMVQLSNVSDTTFVFQQKSSYSLNGAYQGEKGKDLPNMMTDQFWFTPLMFVLFFVYGLVFALRSKSVSRDIRGFFMPHSQSAADGVVEQKTQYRFALTMLGLASMSIFAVQVFRYFNPNVAIFSYFSAVAKCVLASFAYYLFKRFSSSYLGYVFFDNEELREWTHTFNFLLGMIGICLFPVVLCLAYSPLPLLKLFVYLGLIIVFLAEMTLIITILGRFFKYKFSFLYLFLYLCTLEFLPLATLVFGYYKIIATV